MLIRFFTLLFFCLQFFAYAQYDEWGFPLVQIYPPKTYGYESQNFSIVQNNDGIYFISNVTGIMQYDGDEWKIIPISGIPRFTKNQNGIIYIGTYKDFGILEKNQYSKYNFRSLIPSQSLKERIGEISSIIAYQSDVLFVGNYANLYLYDGKKIKILDSTSNLIEIFKVKNKLFVFKEPGGLYQYSNGNLILWLSSMSLNYKIIEFIIPFGNNFLIKYRNEKTIYTLYLSGKIVPFINEIEDYLEEHQYSCNIITSDSIYIFGTYRGGIIGMNNKGKALFHLSTDNLLLNDNINFLFIDKWNNVWAATNNGLARIEISSAFSYFSPINNVKGGVSSIVRHLNKIYIATTQGLFYLDKLSFFKQDIQGNKFKQIPELKYDCNKLLSTPYGLFISTDNGLFLLNNNDKILKVFLHSIHLITKF